MSYLVLAPGMSGLPHVDMEYQAYQIFKFGKKGGVKIQNGSLGFWY